jgi:predicted phage gp36 major capsid-like protein
MDPELFKAFAEALHAELNRSRTGSEQELQRSDKHIRRILDLLADRDDPPHSLMDDGSRRRSRKSTDRGLVRGRAPGALDPLAYFQSHLH